MADAPLIHLDTNHLINIAGLRNGESLGTAEVHRAAYQQLSDWIRDGTCSLCFYPVLLIEWVDGCVSDRNAQQIASVLDSARHLLRIETSLFVFKLELLNALRLHFPQLPVAHVPIVQPIGGADSARKALRQFDCIAAEPAASTAENELILPPTAAEWIPAARKFVAQLPNLMRELFEIWQEFIGECGGVDFDHSALLLPMALASVRGILANLFPDQAPEHILQQIDFGSCRGFCLRTRVLYHYIRLNSKLKENDILDLDQSHIPAYADLVLTEGRMRELYHQANRRLESSVFSSPTELVDRLNEVRLGD